jgi:acetylglutamate kinase
MQDLVEKANVLGEALPYIRRFSGATFVIKYGGHAMVDPELSRTFAKDVALLKFVGINPVVVHGGGPQIDQALAALGVVSERIDGLRVTDTRTMEVVEMVLAGQVNGHIISLITESGGRAVGLSGRDDRFLLAKRVTSLATKSGKMVDPGRVGEMESVNTQLLSQLVTGGFIPVIAPVAVDADGEPLNINADFVAAAVARALRAEKLVLMTDIDGVRGEDGALAASLDRPTIEAWMQRGVIRGGMIPKVNCALDAISGGVGKVHIIDGRTAHAMLLEIFTDRGIGTEIVA